MLESILKTRQRIQPALHGFLWSSNDRSPWQTYIASNHRRRLTGGQLYAFKPPFTRTCNQAICPCSFRRPPVRTLSLISCASLILLMFVGTCSNPGLIAVAVTLCISFCVVCSRVLIYATCRSELLSVVVHADECLSFTGLQCTSTRKAKRPHSPLSAHIMTCG